MGDMHDHETYQIPDPPCGGEIPRPRRLEIPDFDRYCDGCHVYAIRKDEMHQAIEVARNLKKARERSFLLGLLCGTVIHYGLRFAAASFGISFW